MWCNNHQDASVPKKNRTKKKKVLSTVSASGYNRRGCGDLLRDRNHSFIVVLLTDWILLLSLLQSKAAVAQLAERCFRKA